MIRLLFAVSLIFAAVAGHAQDRAKTILVLDASGSMWGQIDGTAKITIAQQVIGGLLETLPAEQDLGLTVYGHRRKGDCGDIETLIQPGGDQRAAIAAAVNAIKPKGKTPLLAAVIAAAEALKYTEDRATVILVSDGRETCDFDPCEVGRQLEEAGVDFTAHVIGFDVDDPSDRAQLQCLAEETGGTFRTASNAGELAEALQVVAEPPAPSEFDVTFLAKVDGLNVSAGLVWTIRDAAGEVLLDGGDDMTPTLKLLEGDYSASVLRIKDGATVERDFVVRNTHQTVIVNLPQLPPEPRKVHYRGQEGKGGPLINDPLVWDIFREDGSVVLDSEVTDDGSIELLPGKYRIEALRPEDEVSAFTTFEVSNSNFTVTVVLPEIVYLATVSGPETGIAGAQVQVEWTGPDDKDDFIAVVPAGTRYGSWIEYTYTREGSTLNLRLPPEGGDYEIHYVLNDGRKVLARQPIKVTPVTATITPPAELPAGATVPVGWTGPDYKNDYIAVVKPGDKGWINYAYTKDGNPAMLQMPGEPGAYEVIYTLDQKRTIITRMPIEVTGISYALKAADTAVAGSTISVRWTGPDYKNDFISIAEVGAADGKYLSYTYTRDGNPAVVDVPLKPGDYDLRYVLNQDRVAMARRPLKVTEVTASISASASGNAGATLPVTWEGPDYKGDYISVASTDESTTRYENYTYTKEGSPLMLLLPAKPGGYELRYVAAGPDAAILARQPIQVDPVTATLEVNATATPGSNLVVTWQGPDYKNDYLAISRADDPNGYESYTYAREGSPLILKVPDAPGAYEVRYVLGQGRTILQRVALSVQ